MNHSQIQTNLPSEELKLIEKIREELYELAKNEDANAIALYALSGLEFGLDFPNEFVLLVSEENFEQKTWLGELICALVKFYDGNFKNNRIRYDSLSHEAKKIKQLHEDLLETINLAEEEEEYEIRTYSDFSHFYRRGTLDLTDYKVLCIDGLERYSILFDTNDSSVLNSKTVSLLRKLAHENCAAAQYMLGLAEDKEEKWLEKASENGFLLASYRLGFNQYTDKPSDAIRYFERFISDERESYNSTYNLCWPDSGDLVHEVNQCLTKLRYEETRKQMLSFLSHTLTNSVAGSADTLRRIAKSLTTNDAGDPKKRIRAAERLAGLMASFSLTESLVSSFKLYVSDPDFLKTAWKNDSEGEVPLKCVVALAIRQSLSQFFFSAEYARDFSRLLPEKNHTLISQQFIEYALGFDLDDNDQLEQFFVWVESKLPIVSTNIDGENLYITRSGTKYILIFSIISELLTNALKYSCGNNPIELSCSVTRGELQIVAKNPVDVQFCPIKGGNKGINFIKEICKLIDAQFNEPKIENNEYIIIVNIPV